MFRITRKIGIAAGATGVAIALAGGGTAYALSGNSTPVAAGPTTVYACVSSGAHGRVVEAAYTVQSSYLAYLKAHGGKCPDGGFEVTMGAQGKSGTNGKNGTNGTNGTAVLSGSAAPAATSPASPQAGDFYIDTSSNEIYGPYSATSGWGTGVSLIGPAGANGTNGTNGTDGTDGTNGQSPVVTQLASGNANCPGGGVSITDPTSGKLSYVCNGSNGTNGTNGASAVTSIQAVTAVTDWPEGSGWAIDNYTRTLSVTVEDQVSNAHCNGAPTCYAVFGTLADTGTSSPVDGHPSPNSSDKATIDAAHISGPVTMNGSADFEFYATSNKISASNVPATVDGTSGGETTTTWGELAFPSGTTFYAMKTMSGSLLTAYDWTYVANVAYTSNGTSISCTQTWNDQVNPGDDGQGPADGDITGTCPS